MTMQGDSMRALLSLETGRLQRRLNKQQQRRTRSQYEGRISSYDADQGVALVALPTGGVAYTESITTSASEVVSVSLPQLSQIGSADAKPVI